MEHMHKQGQGSTTGALYDSRAACGPRPLRFDPYDAEKASWNKRLAIAQQPTREELALQETRSLHICVEEYDDV